MQELTKKHTVLSDVLLPVWAAIMISSFSMSTVSCAAQSINTDKPHHTDKGFRNPQLKEDHGFFSFLTR